MLKRMMVHHYVVALREFNRFRSEAVGCVVLWAQRVLFFIVWRRHGSWATMEEGSEMNVRILGSCIAWRPVSTVWLRRAIGSVAEVWLSYTAGRTARLSGVRSICERPRHAFKLP